MKVSIGTSNKTQMIIVYTRWMMNKRRTSIKMMSDEDEQFQWIAMRMNCIHFFSTVYDLQITSLFLSLCPLTLFLFFFFSSLLFLLLLYFFFVFFFFNCTTNGECSCAWFLLRFLFFLSTVKVLLYLCFFTLGPSVHSSTHWVF